MCITDIDEYIDETAMTKGTFGRPGWFNAVKLEYQACKERVCLIDMSSFTKIEIKVRQFPWKQLSMIVREECPLALMLL